MANFNKVILAGNLTRDVEIKFLANGTAIGEFGLAINRKWKSETGELKESCTFVDMQVWSKAAETLAQYCHKGSPLLVEGRLDLSQWTDKSTGQPRSKLRVVVESYQFLAKTDAAAGDSPAPRRGRPAAAAGAATQPDAQEEIEL